MKINEQKLWQLGKIGAKTEGKDLLFAICRVTPYSNTWKVITQPADLLGDVGKHSCSASPTFQKDDSAMTFFICQGVFCWYFKIKSAFSRTILFYNWKKLFTEYILCLCEHVLSIRSLHCKLFWHTMPVQVGVFGSIRGVHHLTNSAPHNILSRRIKNPCASWRREVKCCNTKSGSSL